MKKTYFLLFSLLTLSSYMSGMDCLGECAQEIKELVVGDNFREVSPNRCYRSKQMSPSHLDTYLRKHKIGYIVNLCSEEENQQNWYKLEKRVAQSNKAEVIDVPLHRKDMPTKKSLLKLLEVLNAHKDDVILIHCLWGIDRTGLVAFLWKFLIEGKSKKEAAKELTGWVWIPWWNHWELNRPNMDEFIRICPNDASDFQRWLNEDYSY